MVSCRTRCRIVLSFVSGTNKNPFPSLAWSPPFPPLSPKPFIELFLCKVSSEVQITSLCTNVLGHVNKTVFTNWGLTGLLCLAYSVGPTSEIQDISLMNLDFWLLLKRLRCGNAGPIFPYGNNWPEGCVPPTWPVSSLLPIFLPPNLFLFLAWLL